MRISDWSSDVCSSDLLLAIDGITASDRGAGLHPVTGRRQLQFQCLRIHPQPGRQYQRPRIYPAGLLPLQRTKLRSHLAIEHPEIGHGKADPKAEYGERTEPQPATPAADRKSTRLNSSH